jgi:uncharacterized membrane protein
MFGPFIFVAGWFLLAKLLTSQDRTRALISTARSWAIVAALPFVALLLILTVLVVTEPGRQFIQGLLSDPQIQQIVGSSGPGPALRAIVLARLRDPWLFLTLSALIAVAAVHILGPRQGGQTRQSVPGDQFAALLFLCGLGLTFVVEFVYLRDTFGVRMNTIFKFYYQAWVMLACASAYGIWWMLNDVDRLGNAIQTLFLVGTAVLVAAGMVYPVLATYSRAGGFETEPNLNGAINIARSHPDDWAAIEWLRANAGSSVPVILEAPGGSYAYEGRISAFTGYPAVLGWALHESQWRGNYVEQGKREPDIQTIYTTKNDQLALDLLHEWDVDYVIVGPPERGYVEDLCSASERQCAPAESVQKFDSLLNPVFQQGRTTVYHVPGP